MNVFLKNLNSVQIIFCLKKYLCLGWTFEKTTSIQWIDFMV